MTRERETDIAPGTFCLLRSLLSSNSVLFGRPSVLTLTFFSPRSDPLVMDRLKTSLNTRCWDEKILTEAPDYEPGIKNSYHVSKGDTSPLESLNDWSDRPRGLVSVVAQVASRDASGAWMGNRQPFKMVTNAQFQSLR